MGKLPSDLIDRLNKQMPAELSAFVALAGQAAGELGLELYVAGGVVRDLFLGRPNQDLDLVTEGDACLLAREIARLVKGRAVYHARFGTATVRWDRWSVDLATARSETYAEPGALPDVKPSDISRDLVRRDFTINAMALRLSPPDRGQLLDPFQGRRDLEAGLIRILHDASFEDDATRIWRAIRYEQRLDFKIESHTLVMLKDSLVFLATISGERLRHELELVLEEERPEKMIGRAAELGVLDQLRPSINIEPELLARFARLRTRLQPHAVPPELYLALLAYSLDPGELEEFNAQLKFPRATYQVLKDTLRLKFRLPDLGAPRLSGSAVYRLLQPYTTLAVLANLFATRSGVVRRRIDLYLNHLRHVQTILGAQDLIALGLPPGPAIKRTLRALLDARLDGQVSSREDELTWVGRARRRE